MTPSEKDAYTQGQIDMVDYCINTFCTAELTQEARIHLKKVQFNLKHNLNGNGENGNRKIAGKD